MNTTSGPLVEYVIVIYARGVITTVIGFADMGSALHALNEQCQTQQADWAYLIQGDGTQLASFRHGIVSRP